MTQSAPLFYQVDTKPDVLFDSILCLDYSREYTDTQLCIGQGIYAPRLPYYKWKQITSSSQVECAPGDWTLNGQVSSIQLIDGGNGVRFRLESPEQKSMNQVREWHLQGIGQLYSECLIKQRKDFVDAAKEMDFIFMNEVFKTIPEGGWCDFLNSIQQEDRLGWNVIMEVLLDSQCTVDNYEKLLLWFKAHHGDLSYTNYYGLSLYTISLSGETFFMNLDYDADCIDSEKSQREILQRHTPELTREWITQCRYHLFQLQEYRDPYGHDTGGGVVTSKAIASLEKALLLQSKVQTYANTPAHRL